MAKRDLTDNDNDNEPAFRIEKRGKPGPTFTIKDLIRQVNLYLIAARNIRSPPAGELFQTPQGSTVLQGRFETQSSNCSNLTVAASPIQLADKGKYKQIAGQPQAAAEHPVDQSYVRRLIEHGRLGILPGGGPSRVQAIPDTYWKGVWQRNVLPNNLPPIGSSRGISPRVPIERAFEALGSKKNRANFVLTSGAINGPKGNAMNGKVPISEDGLTEKMEEARQAGQGESSFLEYIRQVRYLQQSQINVSR